ncbi:MAG: SpoIIE family protein phosphatase, partial [Bacteroidota bacterium]
IQEAMLPRVENIKAVFLDLFIYFKPRDIVSGDFYWFYQDGLKCVIAAVDCTGHGVPGAFMSMIGNNMLHEIVAQRGILEANQILDHLNLGIRKVLRQYETHNQDGMDIALCVIDQQKRIIEFAGAHNPLLFIQDGSPSLIKGDRFPVGGDQYSDDRAFKKHIIPIKKNTIFYIFSDGYQDQFGGPLGRKFMARRLRHVLFEIHHLPMDKQEKILDRILRNWTKSSRQIDDVLIIGIKV